MRLVKRGGGRLIIDRANTFTGGTLIEEGEVVVRDPRALGPGGIDIRSGGRLTIDAGFSRIEMSSLVLASGGRIDVGRGGLVIAPGGAAAAEVRQRLIAGRGQGDWAASTTGIASTAAGPGSGRAVGMITQNDGSILVSYAAPGDLNLDGMVDIIDLADMLGSGLFDTGLAADWGDGDANYDGVVDMLDLSESFATGLFNRGPYLR
jgi:autotransporter-associated beta strand protein